MASWALGTLAFQRPLLTLRANQGCRYAVARMEASGVPWFLTRDGQGVMSGEPLEHGVAGASSSPFETWIAAGLAPQGARIARLEGCESGGSARVRGGVWLAALDWNNRDMEAILQFLDARGTVIDVEQLDLYRVDGAFAR